MVFIVILIASFLFQIVLPWWIIVVVAFATCGLIAKTGRNALWSSFFAILLLWTGMSFYKSLPNNHMLAIRVAEMFTLKSWWLILVITGVLGGFVSAISGFCGYQFKKSILINKTNS